MNAGRESASFRSLGDEFVGTFTLPNTNGPSPALILCHGTGDFKENHFEMSECWTLQTSVQRAFRPGGRVQGHMHGP